MMGNAEFGIRNSECRRHDGCAVFFRFPLSAFRFPLFILLLFASIARADGPQFTDAHIGLDGVYKLGCWTPVEVTLRGGSETERGYVELTLADTDGVPTTVRSSHDNLVRIDPGKISLVRLFVRSGQSNSPLTARFVVDGKVRTRRIFYGGNRSQSGGITGGLPATSRLHLVFGPAVGIEDLLKADYQENLLTKTRIAHLENAAMLPARWIGYEGFDTVLLTTSQPELYDSLQPGTPQLDALQQWVERGGRLVIFCGREGSKLLGDHGPLARLIPGRYEKQVPLRDAIALETLSGSEKPLSRKRLDLQVPKLVDVRGKVLAYAGRQATNLPLVIRAQQGLGEVVFVAVDVDQSPLKEWEGRPRLLRKILSWPETISDSNDNATLHVGASGHDDLTGQLRNALDSQFQGVQTISFAMVAMLAIAYIGLIGPGDFFLLKKLLRRMELTWITFPLIVLGTSAGAYWFAHAMKGDQLRVNQVEIIDVDTTTGLTRGTVWTHFFSPRATQYDLTLQPRLPGRTLVEPQALSRPSPLAPRFSTTVSWLGLPGHALGGMQTSSSQTTLSDRGYRYGDQLQSLDGMPVQVWSTKTIHARWSTTAMPALDIELSETSDKLLTGRVTNHLGVELTDCLLLYGPWAYHLARLGDGATVIINDDLQPRTVKTMLTSSSAGDETVTRFTDDGTVHYDKNGTDVARIVKAMMFYDAIGGIRYTGALNRYQQFIDMSRTLKTGQAILLARCQDRGSPWFDGDRPLKSNDDKHWLYYRFVIPVEALDARR